MKLDLDQLAPVVANKRSTVSFDLQYRAKYGKWRVRDVVFAKLDLNNNGFNLMLHPTGAVVLQLVPENDAQLLRRRGNAANKGVEFTSSTLRTLLDTSGFVGVNDFQITPLGEKDGFQFFGLEEFKASPMVTGTMTVSSAPTAEMATFPGNPMEVEVATTVETIVEEDDAETAEMVSAVEAEAETAEVAEEVENILPIEDQNTEMPEEEANQADNYDFSDTESEEDTLDLEDIPETTAEKPPVKNPFATF
jgi:hypothetical protein